MVSDLSPWSAFLPHPGPSSLGGAALTGVLDDPAPPQLTLPLGHTRRIPNQETDFPELLRDHGAETARPGREMAGICQAVLREHWEASHCPGRGHIVPGVWS